MRRFKETIKDLEIDFRHMPGFSHDGQSHFDRVIEYLSQEVEQLATPNREFLSSQFSRFKEAYERALSTDLSSWRPDPNVYSGENLWEFGVEFLSYLDPVFLQDIESNREWYLQSFRESQQSADCNEILLNVGYPSRQEKEFLKHLEQTLQRKNDDKYRKILKQLEYQRVGAGDEGDEIKKLSQLNASSTR